MEAYRRVYHMPNKTPLSILFEYASRLNLQVCHPLMMKHMCRDWLRSFCRPWICYTCCSLLYQVACSSGCQLAELAKVVKLW